MKFAKFHEKLQKFNVNADYQKTFGTRAAIRAQLRNFTYTNIDEKPRCLTISALQEEITPQKAREILGKVYDDEPLSNKLAQDLYNGYCKDLKLTPSENTSQVKQEQPIFQNQPSSEEEVKQSAINLQKEDDLALINIPEHEINKLVIDLGFSQFFVANRPHPKENPSSPPDPNKRNRPEEETTHKLEPERKKSRISSPSSD